MPNPAALCKVCNVRGTLFGLQIPDAATHVEVRPVYLGPGRRRALYKGPLDLDGSTVSDDDVYDAVASDTRFWAWLDAARRQGTLPAGEPGMLRCRVAVQFVDSGGSPISVTDAGGIWSNSAEQHEFSRADSASKPEGSGIEQLLAAQTQLLSNALGQIAKVTERLPDIVRATVEEACKGAASIIDKGAAPLAHAVDCLIKTNDAAHKRADDATEALVKQLVAEPKKSGADGAIDTIAKGITLVAAFNKLKSSSQPN